MEELLYGREISSQEWKGEQTVLEASHKRLAFKNENGEWRCQRCGNNKEEQVIKGPCGCSEDCFFCAACLNMGKLKKCTILYSLPEANQFTQLTHTPLSWEGELSAEQKRASDAIAETWRGKGVRLIWAVAGSGKTEMIFQGIADCLMEKGRVCIASPRIDVCLELAPRLEAAFSGVPLALLFGGMEEEYSYTPLTIATTHQLLRFKEAFDLLIIDEVDSFPFHNDAELNYGAEKAHKEKGALLYLTATPPHAMQRLVKQNKLQATILPARYHRYPLPEVTSKWLGDWRKSIKKRDRRSLLIKYIQEMIQSERRFLLFMPHIGLMLELEGWLHQIYPDISFTSVSAEDPERVQKVKSMRQEVYQFLITTTILERGVTFRDIDVFVIGTEDRVFTEASLVQIAGRVGRHKYFPTGNVWYGHFGQTRAAKHAIKQIISMNKQARKAGLLHENVPNV